MQKGISPNSDVNESSLQTRNDCGDLAFIDVPDEALLAAGLDKNFGKKIILQDSHTCLIGILGNEYS
ncbi:MAG: hypothetical protein IPI28_13590 [Candidatus Omnitrophica bacterium]|nr:hypothetical protein [Candidatus Omnitrophota bacterium]